MNKKVLTQLLHDLRVDPQTAVKKGIFLRICKKIHRPRYQHRCKTLSNETWNYDLIVQYCKARGYYKHIDNSRVSVVRILSYSRSGSHNLLSRFHYLPSCFVLRENLYREENDPKYLDFTPTDVRTIEYLSCSLFGAHGLQTKKGMDLRHLVLPFNKLLEYPFNESEISRIRGDKVLFLVRNIFRVLLSRQEAAVRLGKDKWNITDERFYAAVDAHHQNVAFFKKALAHDPDRFIIVGHEVFCADPQRVFKNVAEQLYIENGYWCRAENFFVEGRDGRSRSLSYGDFIWDASVRRAITGTGGKYNPVPSPSLSRTLKGSLQSFMKREWVRYAESRFGKDLVELWMSDTPDLYEKMDVTEYNRLLLENVF